MDKDFRIEEEINTARTQAEEACGSMPAGQGSSKVAPRRDEARCETFLFTSQEI